MELGLIRKVDIDSEMQQSYLDYAMSVIVARALPDARDGMKPVQRRILYAMYDMGIRPDTAYKKSARIVGEVLGKYHPHGDMAVYEAMARMAQDFSMRYPLVDGQGNFGSVDGDPPAAMRYTEARLTPPAIHMLAQIEKNTVNFSANFDDTLREPVVLPAAMPNLLVNGATGIAVGMATNIPPHNLGEVVDALVFMLEQWDKLDDIPVDVLMRFIKGPDFPTGGVIIQDPQGDGLTSAYGSGRGRVVVQARAHLEDMGRGRSRIIVTELPYMTNKASLIERIAELVREGHLEGVADLRDESDRQGMRIVIELSKTAEPDKILRELYHRTPMQSTFGISLLALVDGEPRLLSLKQALRVYVEHRLVVVRRRSEYDLERARQRAHILEGLRIAIQNLDEIINLIRSSPDADQAKKRLMTRFKLSELQATAILDMPLRRLAALERKKLEQEYKEVIEQIKNLEAMLRSPKKMRQVVTEELLEVKQAYADRRRTQIVRLKEGESIASMLTTTDISPAEMVWVGVSNDGKICRSHGESQLDLNGRDAPRWLLKASTHHTLYLVSTNGRAAAVAVHSIPEASQLNLGAPVYRVSALTEEDPFASVFVVPPKAELNGDHFVFTATRDGTVKKTALSELPGPSSQTFTLAKVNEGDSLAWVMVTHGQNEILLYTRQGMAIRFHESEVRPMGLVAAGVGGVKLAAEDRVIHADLVVDGEEALLLAADGKAKRVPYKEFPQQSRYGQGVIAWKLAKGIQLVGAVSGKGSDQIIIHFEREEPILIQFGDAPLVTRANQGKPVVEVESEDRIVGITKTGSVTQQIDSPKEPVSRRSRKTALPAEAAPTPISANGKERTRKKPAPEKPAVKKKTAAAKKTGQAIKSKPAAPGKTAKPAAKQPAKAASSRKASQAVQQELPLGIPAEKKKASKPRGSADLKDKPVKPAGTAQKTPAKTGAVKPINKAAPGKSKGSSTAGTAGPSKPPAKPAPASRKSPAKKTEQPAPKKKKPG